MIPNWQRSVSRIFDSTPAAAWSIYAITLWRLRSFPDFVEPCLPSQVTKPPAGPDWIHEIKHDGFRVVARKDGNRVRLMYLARQAHYL
jgi:ATP-dependent DNA ligase